MFKHNLKIAFRNLRKYKTQNIISIIGLAVGFVCFAFSALWIRYEMSYDSFHPKADRIYRVHINEFKWNTVESNSSEMIRRQTPYPLANWLKTNLPEIEEACAIRITRPDPLLFMYLDQNFCKIFDLYLPEDFFIEGRSDRPAAVIPELFHEETIQSLKEQYNLDVQMTIPRWSQNTNIHFNTAIPINILPEIIFVWFNWVFDTYILVKDGVDIQALEKKLDKIDIPEMNNTTPISIVLTPITQFRYKDPTGEIQSEVKFNHIRIFAIAGLLVILCSLFNHLTLFVTCIRMRLRELALRKVNGATDWQIASILCTDFLLIILLSLIFGFTLLALALPAFKEYANIWINNVGIYAELLSYAALLIVCGIIACGIPVLYFRKQVLNESIKGSGSSVSKNTFRKSSLLIQLIISVGMMFCAAVFIKQIRFMHDTDLGINRRNVAIVYTGRCCPLEAHYTNQIKQIPGIIDALHIATTSISFLTDMRFSSGQTLIAEKDGQEVTFSYFNLYADAHFFDFFGIEIVEGMGHASEHNNMFVINETAMNEIGKEVMSQHMDIIGVVRDFYITPTIKNKPLVIFYPSPSVQALYFTSIAYRYEEGMRQQTQQSVIERLRNEFPYQGEFEINFTHMEDAFEEHFKSERALLTLLSLMTLACILIAVFGVYSLTSLTCQQRRKEIAVRKVHGAEVLDILNIFFKEYLILLALAAIVAFPVGFLIMKRWLEGYVKQTSMDAWLYVAIFLAVFVVIVFSIFSTVWRAANRNPAEVVKGG